MKVLVIDSFDSFTYNLCQQLGMLGAVVTVITRDATEEETIAAAADCNRILLSPGPGKPEESALYRTVLETLSRTIPTLGVCLGHQAICATFGGRIVRAGVLMHGKTSPIAHDQAGVFTGLPSLFTATRYHSLVVDKNAIPDALIVSATSLDDGEVMGVRHRKYPIEGVQFHPESILSPAGETLIRNFLEQPYTGRGST
ncbi:anthranilate synthase component II [Methanosphaerula subterraneus]|uniref:anthranilate synthase component II n=1 Tax=Methanosphaerula subterraneus TaxID=3350244 RepID=UPI003F877664